MLIPPNKAPSTRPQQQQQADGGARKHTAQPPAAPEEPAEAVAIKDLLKTLGVKQYDPRIVPMLMDMTYRNTSELLQDAEAINIAAGGTGAELTPQDLALAATQRTRLQPHPPPLQELHALAKKVNAQPLTGPSDKQHGIKLPPVADCLLSQNYQLKARPRPQGPPVAAAAAGAAGLQPQRQHFAVKQQHKIGMQIPQQWQPPADAAAAAGVQPFAPPAYQQQQQQAVQQQQQAAAPDLEQQQAMEVDQEEI